MPTCVDSYTNASWREINTLQADAPFTVRRTGRDLYHIVVDGHTFEVAIREGGRNSALAFISTHHGQTQGIDIEERETNWPQSVTSMTAPAGGFHLEMMDDERYCMVTPGQNFDFKIMSGPNHAYIAVKEISQGVDHIQGPVHDREVNHDRKPRMPGRRTS